MQTRRQIACEQHGGGTGVSTIGADASVAYQSSPRMLRCGGTAAAIEAVPSRRSRLADSLAGLGLPVTVTTGVRLALEPGRGRAAVPVRGVLAGTTLSVLAVTAAFTFGANLVHLVHAPRQFGRTWDAAIDLQFGAITRARTAHMLGAIPT